MAYRSELLEQYEQSGKNRQTELGRLREIVLAGGTAIIAAPQGLGKSYAAARLTELIVSAGGSASTVTCTRSRNNQLSEAAAVDLLVVEDAHLLGIADVIRLGDLASSGRSMIITIDSDQWSFTPREADCQLELTSLWTERGVARVDLSGVGYAEAMGIVEHIAGATRIDLVTRARIVMLAEGNPRLIEELTREELHYGTYSARQQNLMLGPSYPSPRIVDFVRPRLQFASPDEEYALITLGRLGPTPFSRAARLFGHTPLRGLLRRGLVSYDSRTPDCVTSSPVYASAALACQTTENPLEAAHTAELLLLDDFAAGVELTSSECAFVAEFWLNDPGYEPLDHMTASEAARLLARAARYSNFTGMPGAARMSAHRSLAYEPNMLATEQLSRCLVEQGRAAEALDLIERMDVPHENPREDAAFVSWWMQILTRHSRSPERLDRLETTARAWGTVDARLSEWTAFVDARSTMVLTDFAEGIEEMEAIASDPRGSTEFRLRALTELMPAYVYRGQTGKFEEALETGWSAITPGLSSRGGAVNRDRLGVATDFIMQTSLLRAAAGHDRAGLSQELDSFALRAVATSDEYAIALVSLAAGQLAVEQCYAARAENELRHAFDRTSHGSHARWLTWVQLLRANALAMLGRYDEARLIERQVPAMARESTPWLAHYSSHLDIRLNAYQGDTATAISLCRALATGDGHRSRFFGVKTLHVAAAFGGSPPELLGDLDHVAAADECESTVLLEAHLRAANASDPRALDQIGEALVTKHLWWEAVFAFRSAAVMHSAEGHVELRVASIDRIVAMGTRLNEIPGSEKIFDTLPTEREEPSNAGESTLDCLTRREREVAELAGEGMSNAEIAAHLFLSVRTVESHILQARSKLGAARRTDLGVMVSRALQRPELR